MAAAAIQIVGHVEFWKQIYKKMETDMSD